MNERIKELFNKASVYAYEQNPGENSYGRPVDENKYEEDRYTKFAELIVRECAEIAYKTSWDDLVHGYGQAVIPLHLHNTIKQHFGVEE